MAPPKDRMAALKQNVYDDGEADLGDVAVNVEESGAMGEFFKEIDEIRTNMDKVAANVQQVKTLHATILASPKQDPKIQRELDDLMADIKKTATGVRAKLKKMEAEIEEEEKFNKSSADVRIRKTQQSGISRNFMEVMTEYNKAQTDYKDKCKEQIKRQIEITGKTIDDKELDDIIESGTSANLTKGICLIEGDEEQLKATLQDIEARHTDIVKLETSIKELHDMFLDMAMLVESQGEQLDRIDAHVEGAVDYVTSATNDTKKALKYQAKARKKKIMIMLCMIVGGSLATYMVAKYLNIV